MAHPVQEQGDVVVRPGGGPYVLVHGARRVPCPRLDGVGRGGAGAGGVEEQPLHGPGRFLPGRCGGRGAVGQRLAGGAQQLREGEVAGHGDGHHVPAVGGEPDLGVLAAGAAEAGGEEGGEQDGGGGDAVVAGGLGHLLAVLVGEADGGGGPVGGSRRAVRLVLRRVVDLVVGHGTPLSGQVGHWLMPFVWAMVWASSPRFCVV
ncbi:hypothetical protein HFP43_21065 [Streptomyces sp. SJ1-7]|nr:hypothetical protein [Streptomyces sp. SJ1-7]